MGPPIEERLHVRRAECVTGGSERARIGAGEEAVVETVEPDAVAAEALLDPLVAVETELHRIRIRQIRPDFEEGGAPGAILHVKVVVIDGDRLPREIKNGRVATTLPFVLLEGSYLFLSDPDEDDALWGGKLRAVRRHEGVLTVAALERDEGNPMVLRELLDRGDQTIVSGFQQRGGRHGVSQIVVEEVAQTA